MSAVTFATEVKICWSMQDPMPMQSTRVNSGFSPCFWLVLLEQLYRFCNWQGVVVKFYNTVRSCEVSKYLCSFHMSLSIYHLSFRVIDV